MTSTAKLTFEALDIDVEREVEKTVAFIAESVHSVLKRKGAIVGISGGVDSAVVAALCVRALGKERVLGLLMPERHSSEDTLRLSKAVAEGLEIEWVMEEISDSLAALRCYERQEESIRQVIPEYTSDWKSKIVLPTVVDSDRYRVFSVVAQSPDGREIKKRLTPAAYFGLVAATNFKQRVRIMMEYYHADARNYAVAGTPNRLEYDQGFFVKGGDGLADLKPIAHLYKSQVYAFAKYLGVLEEICARPPTTDTYSLPQGQDEFYFSLPYKEMDLCLYARSHGYPPSSVADCLGLTEEQVERVYRDIDGKRKFSQYLHQPPLIQTNVKEA